LDTITRRFGSLENGCNIAGVPFEKLRGAIKYTDAELKNYLRTLHSKHGRPLTTVDIKKGTAVPWWTINHRFGNLEKACSAAGIPFRWIYRPLSDSDILKAVHEVYASTKHPISAASLRASKAVSIQTIINRFGSVKNVCNKAGVPYERLKEWRESSAWWRKEKRS
jgi:hypothetical protein